MTVNDAWRLDSCPACGGPAYTNRVASRWEALTDSEADEERERLQARIAELERELRALRREVQPHMEFGR